MKNKLVILFLALIMLIFVSCSMGEENSDFEKSYFNVIPKMANLDIRNIFYQSDRYIDIMDVSDDGKVLLTYIGESGARLVGYFKDGQESLLSTNDIFGFVKYYKNDSCIITYNVEKAQLELRNMDFELQKVLLTDFHPFEIKEIIIRDNEIYILCVDENPFEKYDEVAFENTDLTETEDGYMDYGEKMYYFDTKTGSLNDTGLTNIISICDSSDQYFYLYRRFNDHYVISVYNPVDKKIVDTINIDEAGYLFSFVVLGNRVYFTSMEYEGICSMNLESKEIRIEVNDVFTARQSDFQVIDDCLIFLNRNYYDIVTLCSGNGVLSSGEKSYNKKNEESDVVIGYIDQYNIPVSIEELESCSGMRIGSYNSPRLSDPAFNEKMMIKLMAGDPDVDIYFLMLTGKYIYKLSKDGVCLPLDQSKVIRDDNAKMFDNISEYFKTSTGYIWGIPMSTDINILASFPDNMGKAGFMVNDLSDFFSMMNGIGGLKGTDGIFIQGDEIGYQLMTNYLTNNNPTNFDTVLFRKYMKNMWDGWILYDDQGRANNPLLGVVQEFIDSEESGKIRISASQNRLIIDPDVTLFNMVSESDLYSHPELFEGIEIFPLPLLSSEYKQTVDIGVVAVVNPYGKNKENAMKLMDQISELVKEKGITGVVYKEPKENEERFTIDTGIIKKLYSIKKNAIVKETGVAADIFINDIPAYQRGEIDLDTAIKSMQRKEDAYRNE